MFDCPDDLTEKELDVITTVFRSYETGLREATINPKDLHSAMKMLGLNPLEQEIIDLTNNIVRNGYIYFPEFCKVLAGSPISTICENLFGWLPGQSLRDLQSTYQSEMSNFSRSL